MTSKCLSLRLVKPMEGNTVWSGVKEVSPGAVDDGVRPSLNPLGLCQNCAKSVWN